MDDLTLFTDGQVLVGDRQFTRLIGGFGEDNYVISDKLGIDNNTATLDQFIAKFIEEYSEVRCAFLNGDMNNMQEELFDTIQVCIGMLDKLDKEGLSLRNGLNKHHKKLVSRGWTSKKMINFTINDWEGK